MKPTLQLKIGQSLTMTPQLQQAIKLLQLSSLDLEAEIQEVLDSNPMLEAEEAQPENDPTSQESEANPAEPVIDFSSSTPSSSDETNLQSQTQEDATINLESGEIGQELPVDSAWEDLYQGGSMPVSSGPSEDDYDLDSRNSPEETLYDSLMWQLNLTPMSDIDQAIALSIIEAINERGYLTTTLEDIRTGLLAQKDVIDDGTLRNIHDERAAGLIDANIREQTHRKQTLHRSINISAGEGLARTNVDIVTDGLCVDACITAYLDTANDSSLGNIDRSQRECSSTRSHKSH